VRGFHPLQSDDSFTLVIHWAPAAGPYVAGPVWDVDLSDPSPRAIPLMKESATFIEPESSFRSFLVGEIKDCGIRMLAPNPGRYHLGLRLSCISSGRTFPVRVQGNLRIVTLDSLDRVKEVYSSMLGDQYQRILPQNEGFQDVIRSWLMGMDSFQEFWTNRLYKV